MSMIHVLCGVSGSGKSYKAKQLLTKYGGFEKATIINRDKIRELLYGYTEETISRYYDSPDFQAMEKNVSEYEDNLVRYTLLHGKIPIIDATHLRVKFLRRFQKFGYPVVFDLVEVDYDTALERDSKRLRKVGKAVIDKQWEGLKNLKRDFDFKPWYPTTFKKPDHDKNKENCVIFDVDGTLADHTGVRSPFDWSKVMGDKLKEDIASLYMLIKYHSWHHGGSPKVIICSGRDGICKQETIEWLHYYGLTFDELYIRKQGDQRPDYEIKEEFWQEISSKYNVVFMVDDRQQVVDHGRRLGFTVLQVDYGDF